MSLDELVDNNIKEILIEKTSNTEKLAGLIIKILKFVGICILAFIIIDVIALIIFSYNKGFVSSSVSTFTTSCTMNEKDYLIEVGSDGYFNCSNCNKELQLELKNKYLDFGDLKTTEANIKEYFKSNNGSCE